MNPCVKCRQVDELQMIATVIASNSSPDGVPLNALATRLTWRVQRPDLRSPRAKRVTAKDSLGYGPYANIAVGLLFLVIGLKSSASGDGHPIWLLIFFGIAIAGFASAARLFSRTFARDPSDSPEAWERARLRYLDTGIYCHRCDLVMTPSANWWGTPGDPSGLMQAFGTVDGDPMQ